MSMQIAVPAGMKLPPQHRIVQKFFIGRAGREKEIDGCRICGFKDCRCSYVIESTAPGHWHNCSICDERFNHCECFEPEMFWKVCPTCDAKVRKDVTIIDRTELPGHRTGLVDL